MITAITPTGDRRICLDLLVRWVSAQTVKPDQWIIIDDGHEAYRPDTPCEYVRRPPKPSDPKHTLNLNMLTVVPRVRGDKIIILEDDEYYAPGYIEAMASRLESYDIVGIGWSKYYHVPTGGYARHKNYRHASFAQTAIRSQALPALTKCAKMVNEHYLDVRLWRNFGGNVASRSGTPAGWENKVGTRGLVFDDGDTPLYVGMKGLPGRGGIGIGHRPGTYRKFDKDRSLLQEWIPKDHAVYEEMI